MRTRSWVALQSVWLVEIPAWEQTLGLIAGVHGTGLGAGSWCVVGLGLRDAYRIIHRVAETAEIVRHVFDAMRNHMHHDTFALYMAGDTQQAPRHHRAAELCIDLFPDHHI